MATMIPNDVEEFQTEGERVEKNQAKETRGLGENGT